MGRRNSIYPLDPSKTKIPVLGMSSERSDMATTLREKNFHHGPLNVMFTFRMEMQVSGGRTLSSADVFFRLPKQNHLRELETALASYILRSHKTASHGHRNILIYISIVSYPVMFDGIDGDTYTYQSSYHQSQQGIGIVGKQCRVGMKCICGNLRLFILSHSLDSDTKERRREQNYKNESDPIREIESFAED